MPEHKCIVDDFGGAKHPYGYCVKPLDEMINYDKIRNSGPTQTVGIRESAGGMLNYATSLVTDPRNAIADECKGILGNKYILRSKMKCKNMDENVHVFINNVVSYNPIIQRKDDNMGIIPATLGSALSINGLPLIRALYESPKQDCVKVKLPCHLIDSTDRANNFSGVVDGIPITTRQYDDLVEDDEITPSPDERAARQAIKDNENNEEFSNLYDSIHSYLDENPELLNRFSTTESIKNINDTDDDLLFNLYYLILCIFLLFFLFKLMNKY
tara:strand:- start:5855 stop:6667 length:813 start_codon:yes stop_codon:yes gene_type:complete